MMMVTEWEMRIFARLNSMDVFLGCGTGSGFYILPQEIRNPTEARVKWIAVP